MLNPLVDINNKKNNSAGIILILGSIFLGILITFCKGTLLMLGVIILVGFILKHFLPEADKKFLLKLFIAGIVLRVIIFAALYIISVLHGGYGELTPDSRLYFLRALDMMRGYIGRTHDLIKIEGKVGHNGYLYILSFFYLLIGYNPAMSHPLSIFSDKLINCLIGTLSGVPIFYITKDIFGRKAAKISSLFAVFYPSFIFWSMTNNRESANILLVALVILSVVKIHKKKFSYFVLLIVSLLLLFTIRPYIFFCTVFILGVFLLIIFSGYFLARAPVLFTISIIISVFLLISGYRGMLKNEFLTPDTFMKKVYERNRDVIAQGGTTYVIYDYDTLSGAKLSKLKFAKGLIKGFIFFMLVPFPWAVSSTLQFLACLQIIAWYILLPFSFVGIILAIRHRFKISFVLISYLLVVTSGFALMEGNVGSAMRHRDLILPFYLIFSAAGIVHIFKRGVLFEKEE